LVHTNQLLYTADKQPDKLTSMVIANANQESLVAAGSFDGLGNYANRWCSGSLND
jgi:hypothetical protein